MTTITEFKIDQLEHAYNFYTKHGMPNEALKYKQKLERLKHNFDCINSIAKKAQKSIAKDTKTKATITIFENTQEIELNNEIDGYILLETIGTGKVVYKLKKLGYEAFMKAKKQSKNYFTDYTLYLQND